MSAFRRHDLEQATHRAGFQFGHRSQKIPNDTSEPKGERMNSRRVCAIVFSSAMVLLAVRGLRAKPAPADESPYAAADTRILAEIHDHSEAMANLEYLSDSIGQRLTGSPQLKQANEWTRDMFQKYGLTNAHLEPWNVARSWTRGDARARILSPAPHPLTIAAAGWSPGTNGAIQGPVVYVDARTKDDFPKFHGKLKGAIIIAQEPASLSPSKPVDPAAEVDRPMQQPPVRIGERPLPDPFAALEQAAKDRTQFFKEEGVIAVLRDSNKPHGLLNMTDISLERYGVGLIPTAFVTGEGYRMIFRLLKHGPVRVELEMTNSFGQKPMDVYNTVAEIRGSEKPNEVVIVGGHLDSWDLGTGSTDNGTGSIAVLEAARTLAKLDLKPKRTIRFVLFTGEEQGLYGSEEYVKAHQNDLENISAVLVHDTGTGRVLTLGLHDNYQDRELVDQVLAPLRDLKLQEPSMARSYGTDHLSFDNAGVPGFFCIQDSAEYRLTHHSQSDTFDKVWKDDLNQGAQVLAAWAYNTAQLPVMLPRRPLPYNPGPEAKSAISTTPGELPKPTGPIADLDTKIIEQVKSDEPELKANLTYLADRIGPRLTGTPKQIQASHWTEEQFKAAGLANVHLEPWTIEKGWTRGTASGHIVSPVEQYLTLAAYGWSPSTNGAVRGPVIAVTAESVADLEKYRGKLKGAIVLAGAPGELVPPVHPLLTPFDRMQIPLATPKAMADTRNLDEVLKVVRAMRTFYDTEGAIAVLTGPDKWYGLLNMSTISREYKEGKVSTASITRENHALITRLMESGSVEVEVNIQNTFSDKPVETYNTVAEIPGTEKPDEVVIIGGHLDSWDLGAGATDNGTGSMAVLEAARALQKLGVKPKRTIRFILFTGEEQGLNGSRAYVKAHQSELGKISGVLVHDSGTGKVYTIGLMHNYGARETIDHALYPLAAAKSIGLTEPSLRSEGGSDHVPFDEAGVPGFWCVQDNADYDRTHHSQADTLDRVRWDDLTEGAQVLAVFGYNVAQLPDLLPRKPVKPKPAGD
jgi:carboxypeptidase Q